MERKHYPGLQIHEDLPQQEREWLIQRIAWFFLYALVIGIMLGLLGQGPLSWATLEGPAQSMRMEYSRFMRYESPEQLTITAPASPQGLRVTLANEYLQNIELDKVSPEPEKVIAQADGRVFVFHTDSLKPVQIGFHIKPQKPGVLDGWVSVADGPPQPFRQFVHP